MQLEELFITQDYGAYTPENHRVWRTLYKRRTDLCGLGVVQRGEFFRDWNQR